MVITYLVNGLAKKYNHSIVSHGKGQYVKGNSHTNTLEGFWSLFKRGIVGQYHQISVKHMNKYIDEFCFRYNNRNIESNITFGLVIKKSVNLY